VLKIDFHKLRSETMPDIIQDLEEGLGKTGIDYYLIGLLARDDKTKQ